MELIKNIKSSELTKNIILCLLGTIILAISSKIKIPFYPVPMTMQTFFVLFLGIALGWKLGVATIILYLMEGIFGLPVFSGTPEKGIGLVYFTGPTMGYLLGFIVACYIAGKLNYNNNFFVNFTKLTFATSFIYLFGIIWLGGLIGWEKPLFELGVQPFLLAELFKLLLITVALSKIRKIRDLI
jgi:biotin transport system substrate-specific component